MCSTCGCGSEDVTVTLLAPPARTSRSGHSPSGHEHPAGPADALHSHTSTIELERAVLAKNDHLAGHNRDWLDRHGLAAVNVMSSPGAGKTTLLERSIAESGLTISVIEGDQETTADAERIRAAGARAVQVNTGTGCHLDAAMVARALPELAPPPGLLLIENVGNLVCPALFALGESARAVVISVTEGNDKPAKYPHMFAAADVVVVNKIDLLPYVDFDLDRLIGAARALRPGVEIFPLSARTGEGMAAWYGWLRGLLSDA